VAFENYQNSLRRMRTGVRTWTERCAGLPPAVLDAQPAPGVWSIKQNTFHLADAFEATTIRAQAILGEQQPQLLRFDADQWAAERDYQGRPWSDAIGNLACQLKLLLAVIGDLDATQLARTGRQYNIAVNILKLPTEVLRLADLVDFEADHVEEHLTSVNEILAAQRSEFAG
jgi:DinB superfamily